MLSYISATRRKSCGACVKAKRRCDLGFPCCNRCFTKGIVCQYRGAKSTDPLSQAEVVVRQISPDSQDRNQRFVTSSDSDTSLTPPESARMPVSSFDAVPFPEPQYAGSQSRDSSSDTPTSNPQWGHYQTQNLLTPASQIGEPAKLQSKLQINYTIDKLSSYVRSFAYAGSTPFLHPFLYERWQPPAYQDACALSALYILKNSRNKSTISNSISAKISGLLTSSSFWSVSDHLAAVQALLIYQIIRLFDGELDQRHIAARHNSILEKWTAELWRRSLAEPLSFPTEHQSWIFYESLRRTVLMSVFLRGAWSCVSNGGFCDQFPALTRLPVTVDPQLWDLREGDWAAELNARAADSLATYGEYSAQFDPGNQGELGEFERLLLVACRGEVAMDSQVPRMATV